MEPSLHEEVKIFSLMPYKDASPKEIDKALHAATAAFSEYKKFSPVVVLILCVQ